MFRKKVLPFILFIAIALAVGGLSTLVSKEGMEASKVLLQPPWAPPDWLFSVVWPILYTLMGISAALVWRRTSERTGPTVIWAVQLFFNAMWSVFYFALAMRGFAFFWLLALIVLVFITILRFRRVSLAAALLQIPYFIWICFAARLNLAVWMLNR
ncbi:MAG: tryptophan-rich sensory protein [Oscillospiraceae bacterium]|nr:tryptophan-rich sensory protein [Oscillospiraceae bacterium]